MTDKSTEETEREKDIADMAGLLKLAAFPLSKRELFAAFYGMGLASRLQPLHVSDSRESAAHRARVVSLSFELADLSLAECAKEPKVG
jgi:uncharacterized protein YhaN